MFTTSLPIGLAYMPLLAAIRHHCNNRLMLQGIEKSLRSKDAPEIDPKMPVTHYEFKTDGVLQQQFQKWQFFLDSNKAEREVKALLRRPLVQIASATDAAWIDVALNEANKARGLGFLPPVAQDVVHLSLAIELLVNGNGPGTAIRELKAQLKKHEKKHFSEALFDSRYLEAVDCTPSTTGPRTYFRKYFQPLMVSFDEQDFEESAGEQNADAEQALTQHLRLLAKKRVLAAQVEPSNVHEVGTRIRDGLPQIARAGAMGSHEVREFNRTKSAESILLVAKNQNTAVARQIEFSIEHDKRFRNADPQYAEWTPRLDKDLEEYCFLWQR